MSKLVVTEFVTLDGVVEDPQLWSISYWNDETASFKTEELNASAAHLLGRVTYEAFAAAWPGRAGSDAFADRMNSLPKYVVSTTLDKKTATWQDSHVLNANLVEAINKLRAQPGGDLLVAGSPTLVHYLAQNNLVDEYHLLVYPVVRGKGKRLFGEGITGSLKLAEAKTLSTGVQLMIYQPTPAEA